MQRSWKCFPNRQCMTFRLSSFIRICNHLSFERNCSSIDIWKLMYSCSNFQLFFFLLVKVCHLYSFFFCSVFLPSLHDKHLQFFYGIQYYSVLSKVQPKQYVVQAFRLFLFFWMCCCLKILTKLSWIINCLKIKQNYIIYLYLL